MATTKGKADQFIRRVTQEAGKARQELGLDRDDYDLRISVTITDRVMYDEHEDED